MIGGLLIHHRFEDVRIGPFFFWFLLFFWLNLMGRIFLYCCKAMCTKDIHEDFPLYPRLFQCLYYFFMLENLSSKTISFVNHNTTKLLRKTKATHILPRSRFRVSCSSADTPCGAQGGWYLCHPNRLLGRGRLICVLGTPDKPAHHCNDDDCPHDTSRNPSDQSSWSCRRRSRSSGRQSWSGTVVATGEGRRRYDQLLHSSTSSYTLDPHARQLSKAYQVNIPQ